MITSNTIKYDYEDRRRAAGRTGIMVKRKLYFMGPKKCKDSSLESEFINSLIVHYVSNMRIENKKWQSIATPLNT